MNEPKQPLPPPHPIKRRSATFGWLAVAGFFAVTTGIGFAILAAHNSSARSASKQTAASIPNGSSPRSPIVTVSPTQLETLGPNFEGHVVEMIGRVDEVKKDKSGKIVAFAVWDGNGYIRFTEGPEWLREGQRVSVVGSYKWEGQLRSPQITKLD